MLPWALAAAALAAALVWALVARWRERRRLLARLRLASEELQRLQRAFSRFAPDELVERIIASGLPPGGERKEVTVLFADLVGFTALSEKVEPPVLVTILNGYFERMSRVIAARRGQISTFIGDGILAFFGALEPNPWQCDDALHAALEMRAALADYNQELEARGLPRLALGIGLHRGTGVAGLVGSQDRKEFAVVGRTVNVAARVQTLTREVGADILLTEAVRRHLDEGFELSSLSPTILRGVSRPVSIYAAHAYAGPEAAGGS